MTGIRTKPENAPAELAFVLGGMALALLSMGATAWLCERVEPSRLARPTVAERRALTVVWCMHPPLYLLFRAGGQAFLDFGPFVVFGDCLAWGYGVAFAGRRLWRVVVPPRSKRSP